jgi:hypothetical protein
MKSAVVKTITVAQLQSLRLLSRSINHYYKLQIWHDKIALAIDDAQRKLRETMLSDAGVLVKLPNNSQGYIKMTQEDLEEAADNWSTSRVQELKVIWNEIDHEQRQWETEASLMLQLSMGNYSNYCPWENWNEAMEWLARYELLELEYNKNEEES